MNARQAREILVAAAACGLGGEENERAQERAGASSAAPAWEVRVRGGESPALSAAPAPGPRKDKAHPFRASAFEEPVASALAAFHALAPVAAIRVPASGGWTLELERPLAWPLFLRCDLAASFTPRAAQLSLILRDARIAALDFDGEALWARLRD